MNCFLHATTIDGHNSDEGLFIDACKSQMIMGAKPKTQIETRIKPQYVSTGLCVVITNMDECIA